jgi:hypothetical protein
MLVFDTSPLFSPLTHSLPPPVVLPYPFYRVHPPLRANSSCVYSQCAVHAVVGPCANGHFIHAGTPWTRSSSSSFLFFLLNCVSRCSLILRLLPKSPLTETFGMLELHILKRLEHDWCYMVNLEREYFYPHGIKTDN